MKSNHKKRKTQKKNIRKDKCINKHKSKNIIRKQLGSGKGKERRNRIGKG
jgi:hypothetical protein